MSVPEQKPGKSKQDYETPSDLLEAVAKRFGALVYDLAARADNAKAPLFITPEEDSLSVDWTARFCNGENLWLNPPFADLDPWAKKCAAFARHAKYHQTGSRIFMLTPASVGANWYHEHVHTIARVLALNPRVTFVGEKDAYPKDCIISIFGDELAGLDVWKWKGVAIATKRGDFNDWVQVGNTITVPSGETVKLGTASSSAADVAAAINAQSNSKATVTNGEVRIEEPNLGSSVEILTPGEKHDLETKKTGIRGEPDPFEVDETEVTAEAEEADRRERLIARAVKEGILKGDDAGFDPTSSWSKLQFVAPKGWFKKAAEDEEEWRRITGADEPPGGCKACDRGVSLAEGHLHTGEGKTCKVAKPPAVPESAPALEETKTAKKKRLAEEKATAKAEAKLAAAKQEEADKAERARAVEAAKNGTPLGTLQKFPPNGGADAQAMVPRQKDKAPWITTGEFEQHTIAADFPPTIFVPAVCIVCGNPQYLLPGGIVCKEGHGGADSIPDPKFDSDAAKGGKQEAAAGKSAVSSPQSSSPLEQSNNARKMGPWDFARASVARGDLIEDGCFS